MDPIIGLCYIQRFADQWKLNLRGDIGGFGVGSSFTYNVAGIVEYKPWKYVSILAGYQTGLEGAHRSIVVLAVVLAFSVVMFVIADLDHSQMGFLQISQQPMIEVQASINKTAP